MRCLFCEYVIGRRRVPWPPLVMRAFRATSSRGPGRYDASLEARKSVLCCAPMFVGKVVGQLWTTKHVPTLEGMKLLLVLPLQRDVVGGRPIPREDLVVVADATVGAGVGEHVVVAYGRAAR